MEKWNWKALALASGIFLGVYLFLATLFAMINASFWWFNPVMWDMLLVTFPGLSATFVGAFIGLAWGFLCGAVCGSIIASLYNWSLTKVK